MNVDILALLGSATLIGCAVQFVRQLLGTERLKWLPFASLLLCMLPVGELSLGYWIHSFTGFLSTPLLVLLVWYAASPIVAPSEAQQLRFQSLQRSYWLLVLIAGSFYFPMSLGLGSFDPHSLGWQPEFVWIPVAISMTMVLVGDYWLAGLFFTSMLAWQLNILGTSNGWSYIIDPIAVGFSAVGLITAGVSSFFRSCAKSTAQSQNSISKKADPSRVTAKAA